MVTQAYTISTVKNVAPPRVKMSQYDHDSRTIVFTVVNGSGAVMDLTGKTVSVEGTRADGHAFTVDCAVNGNNISFTETADMTNQAGNHSAELVVKQDGQRLGTMNFIVSVEAAAMDENASITPEDQSLFEQLYGNVDDAVAEVDAARDVALAKIEQGLASGSPLVANTAAEMTDTDEVYLYTGSESGYTAGSWYYYNGTAWVVGGVYGAGTTDTTLSLAGVAADAKATGDDIREIKDVLTSVRIPIYPNQFIGNTYKNASGTSSDNQHCIVTERNLVFKNLGVVHVYTTDNNLSFAWKLSTDSALKTGVKDFSFSGNAELQLNIMTDDNTPVKSSDLNSIVIESNEAVYSHYIEDNFFKPTTSNRFDDYGGDNVHRYGMYNSGNQIGFAQRGQAYYRITSMPCLCDNDLTIYCGINNSLNLEILINGSITTITYGQWFKVPKGTIFAVAFKSTSRNSTNNISTSGIYIVDGYKPTEDITQYISQAVVTRADCGFMVNDKVFLVSNTALYSVYSFGSFLVTDETLDHAVGHANSCNYYDGKVYISNWTDSTLIHVFDVDAENNTLAYSKDISIPIENVGRVEYFVRSGENEIFFIGWQNGDSSVNPNTLIYGLYILTTEGYEQAWIRKALRPNVLQSFTMQGNYIYMVECDSNYKTTGIIALNMETGLTHFSEAVGTIKTFEGETIIPIGEQCFIIADSRGRLFVKTVVL